MCCIARPRCYLTRYLGDTEANIRKVFARARELAPCILFIEHIEVVGLKRRSLAGG